MSSSAGNDPPWEPSQSGRQNSGGKKRKQEEGPGTSSDALKKEAARRAAGRLHFYLKSVEPAVPSLSKATKTSVHRHLSNSTAPTSSAGAANTLYRTDGHLAMIRTRFGEVAALGAAFGVLPPANDPQEVKRLAALFKNFNNPSYRQKLTRVRSTRPPFGPRQRRGRL